MRRIPLIVLGVMLAQQASAAGMGTAPLWGFLGLATPRETSADIGPFGHAKQSLPQAIDALQKQTGGRIVEIGFAHKNGAGWYRVLVADQAGLHSLRVDAASGAIGKGDQADVTPAQLDVQGQRDLDGLRTATVDLAQAVQKAEAASGGKAVSAGVEELQGLPQYYVQTVVKGKLTAMIVDPRTGRVTNATA